MLWHKFCLLQLFSNAFIFISSSSPPQPPTNNYFSRKHLHISLSSCFLERKIIVLSEDSLQHTQRALFSSSLTNSRLIFTDSISLLFS
ncbi:hypothetical protein VTL71DRAFT_14860 [Oculimacula yallundae]|uniref:Secreted protein n=1 Tax=Oculimacula yallundae TaxID=86028 RepID=A0ABR4CEZ0_9HELO